MDQCHADFGLENVKRGPRFQSFLKCDKVQVVEIISPGRQWMIYPAWSKYDGWCPGNSRSQYIGIYDIGIVLPEYSGFSTRRVCWVSKLTKYQHGLYHMNKGTFRDSKVHGANISGLL